MRTMKILSTFLLASFVLSCNSTKLSTSTDSNVHYAKMITAENLKEHLYVYAGDEMEGRMTGTEGQRKASAYIRDFYIQHGVASPLGNTYYQSIPGKFFRGQTLGEPSENVLAYVKGSEKPDEIIVISAHLDHVGMDSEGNIYNGADDDGSGTVSVMEIARAFQQAANDKKGPKRSVLFLHVTGEEIGLYGSRYYVENPVFPLENTVCNLNIDMIGRIDPDKKENSDNYVYLIGSNMLSQDLQDISTEVNKKYIQMDLDYKFDDPKDPNRFYYRSDHYNFAKNNIPVIFYFNGTHEDYHGIGDTPDKIEYELMAKRAQLIFLTAWELANRDERIKLNKK